MAVPTKGMLAELVTEGDLKKVADAFVGVISASFLADNSNPTTAETKRRFEICLTIFCELRRDLKWSTPRIVDALPRYLRGKLDGVAYSPDADGKRASWAGDVPDPLFAERGLLLKT